MMRYGILKEKNDYQIVEPLGRTGEDFGFVMVCKKDKVLRFYKAGNREVYDYFDYISLSKWDKLKYWLNYKRKK